MAIADVLSGIPHFERFYSVDELAMLAESLRSDSAQFDVQVAGTSANDLPIHHCRFGAGRSKALFVGFIPPAEPIGGLTIASLLTLWQREHKSLRDADVEWHVVPCIDPDGAKLNEGWSQQEFT